MRLPQTSEDLFAGLNQIYYRPDYAGVPTATARS